MLYLFILHILIKKFRLKTNSTFIRFIIDRLCLQSVIIRICMEIPKLLIPR